MESEIFASSWQVDNIKHRFENVQKQNQSLHKEHGKTRSSKHLPLIPDAEKEESTISSSEGVENLKLVLEVKPRPFIISWLIHHFISSLHSYNEKVPMLSNLCNRLSSESFDHIIDGLLKSSDRQSILSNQKLLAKSTPSNGYKLCSKLKHFKQANSRQRSAGMLTDPQILSFADRQFDVSHLPAGLPHEISDMKLEQNRLMSFSVKGLMAFKEQYPQGQSPEKLAALGLFYLQEADKVKCAFCLGTLNCQSSEISVQDAHKLRFATCPLLLGLDVGNVPIQKRLVPQETQEPEMETELCLDDSLSCPQTADCYDFSPKVARSPELEGCSQLAARPRLPVSAAVAARAYRTAAADNLETLARSLGSAENAFRYHPMRHVAFKELRRREESYRRSSQPVPTDLLAYAGFFLDSELNTTCYWCGLQITNWLTSDNPWTEHARWSPRCCHLLLERGHEFVLLSRQVSPAYLPEILRKHQLDKPDLSEFAPEEPSGSALSYVSGSHPLIDYRIEPRYFKAREDFPSTLAILQIGCDAADAKTAQFLQLKSTGDDFPSYEMFMHSVLACSRERNLRNLTGQEYYEQVQKDQAQACSREPKPLDDEAEFDWRGCKVCMDKMINVTLLDCKHLCCCSTCAKQLDSCPLCRTPIRATMLVNMD